MRQMRITSKRHRLDPAEMRQALADISPAGEGAAPLSVVGWTRSGVWTRLAATYPNGWALDVYFDKTGRVSSATSRFTLRAAVKGAE